MDRLLSIVKGVVSFTLIVALLSTLFSNEEYKKYFKLITGFMTVAMVLSPIISFLVTGNGDGSFLENLISGNIYQQEVEEQKKEIALLGASYEEEMQRKMEESMRQHMAEQCGVTKEECQILLQENQIVAIRITPNNPLSKPEEKIVLLSQYYGVEKENIFIEEH